MFDALTEHEVPLEVLVTLLGCAVLGVAAGEVVSRARLLHRRARVRALVAMLYVCFSSAVLLFVGPELSTEAAAVTHPWLLGGVVAVVCSMFGPLRRFFAYALIPFEDGERVRIGMHEGTVVYYSWTGLELSTARQTVIIPVLDLYDVVITRFPAGPDNEK